MKYSLSEIKTSQENKIAVPDIIHFVWVGNTNAINYSYIKIWRKVNKDKLMYLWCDKNTKFIKLLHQSIDEYTFNDIESSIATNIKIKNSAFNYIFPKLKEGFAFDDLVITFMIKNEIPFKYVPELSLENACEIKDVVKRDISELFSIDDFSHFAMFYYYEIILRGNLASASDIIRLLVIYVFGGIYIDVDTLPSTNDVFLKFNKYVKEQGLIEDDFMFLYKRSVF